MPQQLIFHLQCLHSFDPFPQSLVRLLGMMRRLFVIESSSFFFDTFLPNFVVVLQWCPTAVALEGVIMLQNGADVAGTVVSHVVDSSGLLIILVFQLLDLLIFLDYYAVKELMLVRNLIQFVVLAQISHQLLEVLDPLPVL
jgi:hypothetical protein